MNIPGSWLPLENKVFRLRHIGFNRIEAGEDHSELDQEASRLLLVVTGEGVLESGRRKQLLRPGSWMLLLDGAPYGMLVQEGIGITYYEMVFHVLSDDHPDKEAAMPGERVEETGPLWCGSIPDGEFSAILTKAKQLYVGRHAENSLERFQLQLIFAELMYMLVQTASARLPRKGSAEEAIGTVIRYMEGHFQQSLSRERLAGLAGMNQEYFSRLFKRITGKTPKAYLTDIRLNHAKRELLRGNAAVSDIAQHVGFEEGYYFSRKFRQKVGMAPTEYASKQVHKVACTFFPFIDHILALGITPYAAMIPRTHPLFPRIASSIHLGEEELEINGRVEEKLAVAEPEMILCSNYLNPEQEALLSRIAPTVPVIWDQNWRKALREIADVLGRVREAEEALAAYEQSCREAGERLRQSLGDETVALLRIHKRELRLYGGPEQGYTGPVLYGELGLKAPTLVQKLAWNTGVIGMSLSMLTVLEADHILLIVDPDAEQQAAELIKTPEWQGLRAVCCGKVHQGNYWVWMSCGLVMNGLKLEEAVRLLGAGQSHKNASH